MISLDRNDSWEPNFCVGLGLDLNDQWEVESFHPNYLDSKSK